MREISCTFETSCGIMLGWGTFAIGCVSPECFTGLQDIQCSYHLSQHQCNVLWYVFVVCVYVRCASRDWGMNALTKPKNQIHSILMTSASSLPIYQILIYLQLPSSLALCPEHVSVRWSATVGSSPWFIGCDVWPSHLLSMIIHQNIHVNHCTEPYLKTYA